MRRLLILLLLCPLMALAGVNKTLNEAQRLYDAASTVAQYQTAKKKYQSAKYDVAYVAAEHDAAINQGVANCNRRIDELSPRQQTPKPDKLTITNVSFANGDGDGNMLCSPGSTLYSSSMRHLFPYVTYKGASKAKNSKVEVRIINPDGHIREANSSGFTYDQTWNFTPGTNSFYLLGWGRGDYSTYPAGSYRFELWIDGNYAYSTSFTIH